MERRAEGAFITSADIPAGDALRGAWMIVTHGSGFTHGYPIDHIERRDGQTVIVLAMDPGLRLREGTTEEAYFPQRKLVGPNTFAIPLAATVGPIAADPQRNPR